VELGNMESLRLKHECRKFFKEINVARNQFKTRVHICWNEDGSLISNEREILDRWVRHLDIGSKDNEVVTFTIISKGKR
jgi:hypothetical protein